MAGLIPAKVIFYAMTVATYARTAGDIPDIQDKAAEVILDAAGSLPSSAQRHNAIAFAQRHAVRAATQSRAALLLAEA